jgi:hypothetical protein
VCGIVRAYCKQLFFLSKIRAKYGAFYKAKAVVKTEIDKKTDESLY